MTGVSTTRVKVCGVTTLEDALLAIKTGAAMLGFNFYPNSPRCISPEAAKTIISQVRGQAECVGVFVNEPLERLLAIVSSAGLATAQLHGHESPEYYAEVSRVCGVIKALRVGEAFRPEVAARFGGRVLLDSASAQFGGSGMALDWSIVPQVRQYVSELILAGGLHAGNVAEAIAIAAPDVLDACSGLESAPGRKDKEKIIAFMAAVRSADAQRKAKVLSA